MVSVEADKHGENGTAKSEDDLADTLFRRGDGIGRHKECTKDHAAAENMIKRSINVTFKSEGEKEDHCYVDDGDMPAYYPSDKKVNTADASKVVAITAQRYYELPKGLDGEYTYVVTVLDRMQNESDGVKCKVKL